MRFRGKVAIVSGAGSGIGKAIAEGILAEGGMVALFGRTEASLRAVAAAHPADRVLVHAGRHEHEAASRDVVARTVERWGRIDCVVNNAGSYRPAPVAETSLDDWQEQLAGNLTGPFLLTRSALPQLRQGRGSIVNIASTLGLKPVAGTAAYAVAKAGLVMLTRAAALEEAPHGVRVNAICPGVVETPIHGRRFPDAPALSRFLAEAGAAHPLGRVGRPEEVAAMALFLASDASPWTTGAVVTVDGGISLA